jgi:hypothetical protein
MLTWLLAFVAAVVALWLGLESRFGQTDER